MKASPLARRLAREQGIDLHAVTGTGPGGRIVKDDVQRAASAPRAAPRRRRAAARAAAPRRRRPHPPHPRRRPPLRPHPPHPRRRPPRAAPAPPATVAETGTAKGDVTTQELTRTQGLIARRMAESRATIPTFELRTEIDMEACVALRAELKALGGDGACTLLQRHGRQGRARSRCASSRAPTAATATRASSSTAG